MLPIPYTPSAPPCFCGRNQREQNPTPIENDDPAMPRKNAATSSNENEGAIGTSATGTHAVNISNAKMIRPP